MTCEHCGEHGPGVAVFVNRWDGGSEIRLCADTAACKARQREQARAAVRA